MLYCTKCRRVCGEDNPKCPHCRSHRLRPAAQGDRVAFWAADEYTAGRIAAGLAEAGIECVQESSGGGYYSFECTEMPTDRQLLVSFAQLEEAKRVATDVACQVEQERGADTSEETEPPRMKRLIGEVLSILVFMVLVMLAVFGADAVAGWIKGLFG